MQYVGFNISNSEVWTQAENQGFLNGDLDFQFGFNILS